jgi:hypothetical protein
VCEREREGEREEQGAKQVDLKNLFLKKEIRISMPLISIDLNLDAVIVQVKCLVMYYELFLIVSVLSNSCRMLAFGYTYENINFISGSKTGIFLQLRH